MLRPVHEDDTGQRQRRSLRYAICSAVRRGATRERRLALASERVRQVQCTGKNMKIRSRAVDVIPAIICLGVGGAAAVQTRHRTALARFNQRRSIRRCLQPGPTTNWEAESMATRAHESVRLVLVVRGRQAHGDRGPGAGARSAAVCPLRRTGKDDHAGRHQLALCRVARQVVRRRQG